MDLESLQDLSKLNFPATIKIRSKSTSRNNNNNNGDDNDGLSCSTPTSQEHKIPSVVDSPPPPPRKPRPPPSKPSATAALMIRSCKRKLLVSTCEIIMNREEIDRFFSSVYNDASTTAKRRRSYPYCARR
uniref:Cyclin-dependent protein kinase inhibitor SMR1 n=1 Tax=Noccaea caerulescens TaxID=107243 RepID=A0A1J3J5U4_NOCCA